MELVAWAIPVFGAFMWLEHLYIRKRKPSVAQSFEASVSNINVGIAERFFDVATVGAFYWVFETIYIKFRLFTIPTAWYWWVILLLATDLLWYWYHRFGHKVNLFWAAHVVHHQSEEFNYTVAARITVLQAAFRCVFWSFLPLVGFHPAMVTTILLVHGAYPFFTHTETIGTLGWLEYVLVTPSHHRVHHSSNPQYLDKNYSDIFIWWDKLFGTFAEEDEKPVYGLTQPLSSHSFLWQHFHFFLEIFIAFHKAEGWKNKLHVVFGEPGDLDPVNRDVLERWLKQRRSSLSVTPNLRKYILVQTIASVVAVFFLVAYYHYIDALHWWFAGIVLLFNLIIVGAVMEQKKWIFHLEAARFFLLLSALLFEYPSLLASLLAGTLVFIVVAAYKPLEHQYKHLLFYRVQK